MKQHDYKIDTTPIYHNFQDGRFLINSPSCILSSNQIVQIGEIYLFSNMPDDSQANLMLVKLLNVRYDDGYVCLQLMDILTGKVFDISQVVRPKEVDCTWMLVDLQYFNEKLRKKKVNHSMVDDTLLEFEF